MRRVAELGLVRGARNEERAGAIGKVERLVQEDPGLRTRDIVQRVGEPRERVSGALNKLKLDGRIEHRTTEGEHFVRWYPTAAPVVPTLDVRRYDAVCPHGVDIVWGSLATLEERAAPTCSSPFADGGASL